uniref:Uncharacterized protein n=1 Tax=Ralstonia solanacearum TaxID=305 RepID=A0A0S4U0M4_RALSL|nr:protein of unknown function [Ralstonia solanacearum]
MRASTTRGSTARGKRWPVRRGSRCPSAGAIPCLRPRLASGTSSDGSRHGAPLLRHAILSSCFAFSPPVKRLLSRRLDIRKRPANPSCQLGDAGSPAMRKQFGDVGRFVGRQSREDVFQVGVRVMPVELGRLDQAHNGSRALTGAQ